MKKLILWKIAGLVQPSKWNTFFILVIQAEEDGHINCCLTTTPLSGAWVQMKTQCILGQVIWMAFFTTPLLQMIVTQGWMPVTMRLEVMLALTQALILCLYVYHKVMGLVDVTLAWKDDHRIPIYFHELSVVVHTQVNEGHHLISIPVLQVATWSPYKSHLCLSVIMLSSVYTEHENTGNVWGRMGNNAMY